MRVITLAGSPRFPSRSSALLEYAREKLNALDVEVCHWNLHNFEPEDLLYARFDSPALKAQEILHGVFADDSQVIDYQHKPHFTPNLQTRLDNALETFWHALHRRDIQAPAFSQPQGVAHV